MLRYLSGPSHLPSHLSAQAWSRFRAASAPLATSALVPLGTSRTFRAGLPATTVYGGTSYKPLSVAKLARLVFQTHLCDDTSSADNTAVSYRHAR